MVVFSPFLVLSFLFSDRIQPSYEHKAALLWVTPTEIHLESSSHQFFGWYCSFFSSGGGVPSTFLSFRLFLVTAEHITMSIYSSFSLCTAASITIHQPNYIRSFIGNWCALSSLGGRLLTPSSPEQEISPVVSMKLLCLGWEREAQE